MARRGRNPRLDQWYPVQTKDDVQ